jgi:hypothetical protein
VSKLVDLVLPPQYHFTHFWWATPKLACGVVAAVSFRSWVLGLEIITGDVKGLALLIGPFWFGFAGYAPTPATVAAERGGRDG